MSSFLNNKVILFVFFSFFIFNKADGKEIIDSNNNDIINLNFNSSSDNSNSAGHR